MADQAVTKLLVKGPPANNELGRGWTHQATVKWSDFVATAADNDTNTFSLFTIPAHSFVTSAGYRLKTAFDDSGGGSSLTMALGDDDGATSFMTAKQLHVDGTEVFSGANDGAYFTGTDSGTHTTVNVIKGKHYTAAKTLKAVFTPASFELEECTQGEVVIFANIVDTATLISG